MRFGPTFIAAVLGAFAPAAFAQATPSPYAQLQAREIKALSFEQIRDLREARGMGQSLPAELNGAPGPLHALELRQALGISSEQAAELEAVTAAMRTRAKSLGEDIIRAEAALDTQFKTGTPDEAAIDALTAQIGLLSGLLRAAHLNAHLQTKRLLTPVQVAAYDQARGYGQTSTLPSPDNGTAPSVHRHH